MYPEWVEKIRKENKVSVKESKGFYYAYKCTSVKVEGKPYPVSKQTYVGRITEDGIIPAITLSFTPLKTEASTIGDIFSLDNIEESDKSIIKDIIIIKARKVWYLTKLTKKQSDTLAKYNKGLNGEVIL